MRRVGLGLVVLTVVVLGAPSATASVHVTWNRPVGAAVTDVAVGPGGVDLRGWPDPARQPNLRRRASNSPAHDDRGRFHVDAIVDVSAESSRGVQHARNGGCGERSRRRVRRGHRAAIQLRGRGVVRPVLRSERRIPPYVGDGPRVALPSAGAADGDGRRDERLAGGGRVCVHGVLRRVEPGRGGRSGVYAGASAVVDRERRAARTVGPVVVRRRGIARCGLRRCDLCRGLGGDPAGVTRRVPRSDRLASRAEDLATRWHPVVPAAGRSDGLSRRGLARPYREPHGDRRPQQGRRHVAW